MIREIAELTEFKAQNTKNMEMPDSDGDQVVYKLKDGRSEEHTSELQSPQ